MSGGAWLMLGLTWSVVIGVSSYLFWKVVARSRGGRGEGGGDGGDGGGGV